MMMPKEKKEILKELLTDKGGWNGNIDNVDERIEKALKEIDGEDDTTKTY